MDDELLKRLGATPVDGEFTGFVLTTCFCEGTGLLDRNWVFNHDPQCTCSAQTDDFIMTLHALDCDSVPCPFCQLEGSVE